ncbi:winged helix-turn-helix transcriptional regulator [Flavobacterium sp. JAS]|uniref:winged helix-turn-helix transcriptional regulator n=1 Tax=Flavobacterium sp. JAS TaxID=2897329 RepID=UPI00351CCD20
MKNGKRILGISYKKINFVNTSNFLGAVQGTSPKILAKELKDLELNDFVKRTVHQTIPVSVVYEVTDYSKTLKSVIHELSNWGKMHREKVKESMRK